MKCNGAEASIADLSGIIFTNLVISRQNLESDRGVLGVTKIPVGTGERAESK